MNIPSDPTLAYLALVLFLIGFFLFIAGLDIVRIERITVARGAKTWIMGVVLMAAGALLGLADQRGGQTPMAALPGANTDADRTANRPASAETVKKDPETRTGPAAGSSATAPRVKYADLAVGDQLFTRGCSKSAGTYWVNRFRALRVDGNGIVWGSYERAETSNPATGSYNYRQANRGAPVNLSETCASGGCYTRESYAVADLERWQAQGCPW